MRHSDNGVGGEALGRETRKIGDYAFFAAEAGVLGMSKAEEL